MVGKHVLAGQESMGRCDTSQLRLSNTFKPQQVRDVGKCLLVQAGKLCYLTHRIPGYNTAQVRADRVEAIVLDATVISHDEVCCIALQAVASSSEELGLFRCVHACLPPLSSTLPQQAVLLHCRLVWTLLLSKLPSHRYTRGRGPCQALKQAGPFDTSTPPSHLEALHQRAVASRVLLQPFLRHDIVPQSVFGSLRATGTSLPAGQPEKAFLDRSEKRAAALSFFSRCLSEQYMARLRHDMLSE